MTDSKGPMRWSDLASDAPEQLRLAVRTLRNDAGDAGEVEALWTHVRGGLEARSGGETSDVGQATTGGYGIPTAVVVSLSLAGLGALGVIGWLYATRVQSGEAVVSGDTLVVDSPSHVPSHREAEPPTMQPAKSVADSIAPPTLEVLAASPEGAAPPVKQPPPGRLARHSAVSHASRSPEAELSLITRAQAALDRDPRRALSLASEHAEDYPSGIFREEREVVRMEAELKLGRRSAATARARRFIEDFGHSTHAPRVRALLRRFPPPPVSQPVPQPVPQH